MPSYNAYKHFLDVIIKLFKIRRNLKDKRLGILAFILSFLKNTNVQERL